jgi:D-arabinose 1-dehydrogenase-like Zn-dependent alcohol dehydrogenase
MKAVVLRHPGEPQVLRVETVPDPAPAPREVVLQVAACGVAAHDILVRDGTIKFGVELPCILGHEIAGTVVAVGSAIQRLRVGDRVATTQRHHICGACQFCRTGREPLCAQRRFLGDSGMTGGYADFVAVEEDNIAIVPDEVELAGAAIAASAIGSPYNGIRDVGRLRMGETVLVTGAGGGLGIHALQIAKLAGAWVIAQTTSPEKADVLRAMGADAVVVHARGEDFSQQVRALTAGRGVDMVVDHVGTPVFESSRKSLSLGGRWILLGQLDGTSVPFNPAQLFIRSQSMLSAMSTTRVQLEQVLVLLQRGQIKPVITERLPLEAAAEAHAKVQRGAAVGRVVLSPLH